MMATNEETRGDQREQPQKTGSFFYATPFTKERLGSMTTAESSLKTGMSGSTIRKKKQSPIISHKLMRILDRVSEEDSFKDDEVFFPQQLPIKHRITHRDKSISLDENKMYSSKQDEFSFGKLDEEKQSGCYLLEAHDATKRSKLAKLAYRINAVYKHGSPDGGVHVTNQRMPRSAGSTIEAQTQPDRIEGPQTKVQFGSGMQNCSFKLSKYRKPTLVEAVPSITKGQRTKTDGLRRDSSLQILNLVAQGQQRNKRLSDFAGGKRTFSLSSDSPRQDIQPRDTCNKNAAIEHLTRKYLQRISINSNKLTEKRATDSEPQHYLSQNNGQREGQLFSKIYQPDSCLQNLSISIQAVKKRPKRSQLSKAFGT